MKYETQKSCTWTKEKIVQLIEMYKKRECLWNHNLESYKIKEVRNRAIEEICTKLRITKYDFGKKIHNLRNQFNSEMKKLGLRMEEAGSTNTDMNNPSMRCKWNHFESLMFLKDVIEPRPGGFQTTLLLPKVKRETMRLRQTYNRTPQEEFVTGNDNDGDSNQSTIPDELNQFFCDDAKIDEEEHTLVETDENFQRLDDDINKLENSDKNENHNQKCQETATAQNSSKMKKPSITNTVIEIVNGNCKTISAPNKQQLSSSVNNSYPATGSFVTLSSQQSAAILENRPNNATAHDEWDAFGNVIATELRNLYSDTSRKKLKRKIMQAILDVGEEDDELALKMKNS
uniref:MADF domain-containing protein n=1 Tax=Glossina brevipalpis TaxID=37001 RepID=A0A1A9X4H8_9MUSC